MMTKDFKSGFISALMVACLFVAGCTPEGGKTEKPADAADKGSASAPYTLTLSIPESALRVQKDDFIVQEGETGFVVTASATSPGKRFFPTSESFLRFHFPSKSITS